MARLRLQAPVRRPSSKNTEPRNLLRIHDTLQLKNTDGKSRLDTSEDPKLEEMNLSGRRRHDYRDSYHQFSSQRSTVQDAYLDLSPPRQHDYLRSAMGSVRGSLLESESAFIDPLGDAFPLPRTPESKQPPQLSARERRRLAKQSQQPQVQGQAASSQHYDYNAYTDTRMQQEAEQSSEGGSRDRTGRHRGNTAGQADLSDDEFSLHNLNYQGSVETDPWMRPGTSDTLKCLDRPSRRQRLTT